MFDILWLTNDLKTTMEKTQPKFNWWQTKFIYVLTPLTLERTAKEAYIDFQIVRDRCRAEGWDSIKARYQALTDKEQHDDKILNLLVGADNGIKLQFAHDLIKRVDEARNRTPADIIKAQIVRKFSTQLAEFGMSERDGEKFLEEYEKALGIHPSQRPAHIPDPVGMTPRENLDVVNAGYEILAQGTNLALDERIKGIEKAIEFWELLIEDMEKHYRAKQPSITYEEMVAQCRPMSYAAQSQAKLLDMYYKLTGIGKYVDVQSALAKLRSMGYHCIHDDQLKDLVDK